MVWGQNDIKNINTGVVMKKIQFLSMVVLFAGLNASEMGNKEQIGATQNAEAAHKQTPFGRILNDYNKQKLLQLGRTLRCYTPIAPRLALDQGNLEDLTLTYVDSEEFNLEEFNKNASSVKNAKYLAVKQASNKAFVEMNRELRRMRDQGEKKRLQRIAAQEQPSSQNTSPEVTQNGSTYQAMVTNVAVGAAVTGGGKALIAGGSMVLGGVSSFVGSGKKAVLSRYQNYQDQLKKKEEARLAELEKKRLEEEERAKNRAELGKNMLKKLQDVEKVADEYLEAGWKTAVGLLRRK